MNEGDRTTLREHLRRAMPLLAIVLPIVLLALVASQFGDAAPVRAAVGMLRGAADQWWAVPAFVIAYILGALFFLPLGLLSATAAVIWGWKVGGAIELLTCTLASLPPYYLARAGAGRWIRNRVDASRLPLLEDPFNFFLLRLLPVIPYVLMNYLAGMTSIGVRHYLLATFFGAIPSVFLFTWFVDTLAGSAVGAVEQAKIFAACALVALFAAATRLLARRLVRRGGV